MARKRTPAKSSKAKSRPDAKGSVVDPVADALSHQPARQAALEAALRASPGWEASVKVGQQWEAARQAVDAAVEPYNAALLDLDPDDPKRAEKSEALRARIGDVREQTLAKHGFALAIPPKSPAELLERLNGIELNWWFDLEESANRPRPTELLWQDADRLRKRDPFLPPLPAKPDDGRERYVVLVRWCGDCERDRIATTVDQTLGAKPPADPPGTEAIDDSDVLLLEYLNRNPSLRRKVSDVLPDRGPQDRKAIGWRLRKLADRTPPLVCYPKKSRSGVAILPAGVEALKRATATTHH